MIFKSELSLTHVTARVVKRAQNTLKSRIPHYAMHARGAYDDDDDVSAAARLDRALHFIYGDCHPLYHITEQERDRYLTPNSIMRVVTLLLIYAQHFINTETIIGVCVSCRHRKMSLLIAQITHLSLEF